MQLFTENPSHFDYLLYRVKPNDTLTKILTRYHPTATAQELQELLATVQANNPAILDPNRIYIDQLIQIPVPQLYCPAPLPENPLISILSSEEDWFPELQARWQAGNQDDKDLISSLLPVFLLGTGSAKLSLLDNTFSTNTPLMRALVENYEDYKAGSKSKGQYDYQRRKLLDKLTSNLGPTNFVLNGTSQPREVLRISRIKGESPTQPIQAQVRKMKQVSQLAKGGGIVLTGVGLGIACDQIKTSNSLQEKNEILVESAGSVATGVVYSIGTTIGLVLLATPVGWVGALAIGVGGAIASYGGGKIARKFYSTSGNDYDFVGKIGVDQICVASGRRPTRRLNSVYSNNVIMGY